MNREIGQGQFQLDVETLEAEGEGCGIDYLDIQVHCIPTDRREVNTHECVQNNRYCPAARGCGASDKVDAGGGHH